MQTSVYDQAWCVAAALSFLNHANRDQRQLFNQYRARSLQRASSQLTDEMWQKLMHHPSQDADLSALFALIAGPIASLTARAPSAFGLKRKDRVDTTDDADDVTAVFRYVTAALSVTVANVYIRADDQTPLRMAHTTDVPSFVVGLHLLKLDSQRAATFLLAKQLALLRPEHFLRLALGSPVALEIALTAAFKWVGRPAPGETKRQDKHVRRMVTALRQALHRSQVEQLTSIVERLQSSKPDLARFWNATELTADRAAMLLCTDLEVATRMIGADPGGGNISASDRVKQLVQFVSSPQYFELRRRLGLTIAQQAALGESRAR